MSTAAEAATDPTVRLGLLMETAHAQQQLVEQSLTHLQEHTLGLDAVVREEIRHAFVTECGTLVEHADAAAASLQRLMAAVSLRFLWSAVAFAGLCAGVTLLAATRMLPSGAQMRALRAERTQLSAAIAQLQADGGRIELRRCGSARRLCVRVDRHAPAFGEAGDYLVVAGY